MGGRLSSALRQELEDPSSPAAAAPPTAEPSSPDQDLRRSELCHALQDLAWPLPAEAEGGLPLPPTPEDDPAPEEHSELQPEAPPSAVPLPQPPPVAGAENEEEPPSQATAETGAVETVVEDEPVEEAPEAASPEFDCPTHVYPGQPLAPAAAEPEACQQEEGSAFPAQEDEEDPVFTERDYRPIRRRRSFRLGLRGGLMYFGFVVCLSALLAGLGWLAADDVLSLNKDFAEAQIYVADPVDLDQVGTELQSKGLIKYSFLFRIFGKLTHADGKIDPGIYTLSNQLDYNAMIHSMEQEETIVARDTVTIMIPEGKTAKQTFQILAEHGVCPYETLLECAAGYEFDYEFLSDIAYGDPNRLEGYLFPDTYQFYAPSRPEEAISRFLSNFENKFTGEMAEQANEMGRSIQDIITVASLIEMEAGTDLERATVSSVIYNRLSSSAYPYLQIDATIQYALEERKESLSYADLEVDSPYNTYKYTGLPPGPIANPGLASIRAALKPESTGYYFYALNKHGSHNFFTNQSQFEYFVNSSEFGG